MAHNKMMIADAATAAAKAVGDRIPESGDRVSALIAAAVQLNGLMGFENVIRIVLPMTGAPIRVRTVCEVLPDIEVEKEREIDIARLVPQKVNGENHET